MDGWLWDEQRKFSDFAGTLHGLFCFPVCSRLRSSRGVPGASPTCVTDGGWWMVVDGFQKGSLILLKILSNEVYFWKICEITFYIRNKSDFKFQNRRTFLEPIDHHHHHPPSVTQVGDAPGTPWLDRRWLHTGKQNKLCKVPAKSENLLCSSHNHPYICQ